MRAKGSLRPTAHLQNYLYAIDFTLFVVSITLFCSCFYSFFVFFFLRNEMDCRDVIDIAAGTHVSWGGEEFRVDLGVGVQFPGKFVEQLVEHLKKQTVRVLETERVLDQPKKLKFEDLSVQQGDKFFSVDYKSNNYTVLVTDDDIHSLHAFLLFGVELLHVDYENFQHSTEEMRQEMEFDGDGLQKKLTDKTCENLLRSNIANCSDDNERGFFFYKTQEDPKCMTNSPGSFVPSVSAFLTSTFMLPEQHDDNNEDQKCFSLALPVDDIEEVQMGVEQTKQPLASLNALANRVAVLEQENRDLKRDLKFLYKSIQSQQQTVQSNGRNCKKRRYLSPSFSMNDHSTSILPSMESYFSSGTQNTDA